MEQPKIKRISDYQTRYGREMADDEAQKTFCRPYGDTCDGSACGLWMPTGLRRIVEYQEIDGPCVIKRPWPGGTIDPPQVPEGWNFVALSVQRLDAAPLNIKGATIRCRYILDRVVESIPVGRCGLINPAAWPHDDD